MTFVVIITFIMFLLTQIEFSAVISFICAISSVAFVCIYYICMLCRNVCVLSNNTDVTDECDVSVVFT